MKVLTSDGNPRHNMCRCLRQKNPPDTDKL